MTKKGNKLILIGNPNVGKTTLFNYLTNSFEHTGNWHGVTVDEKEKDILIENNLVTIVDLPGLYSLSSYSFEEQVAIDYLLKQSERESIINVCDANLLERNLYLTLQLIEMGINPILFINFDKEIKKKGIEYNYRKLSDLLNINLLTNSGMTKYKLIDLMKDKNKKAIKLSYINKLPLNDILDILARSQKENFYGKENFLAIKILEKDENIIGKLKLTSYQKSKIKNIIDKEDYQTKIAKFRYEFISEILSLCKKEKKENVYGKFFIDKVILNKFLCLPIFLLILTSIFFITFSSLGDLLSQSLKTLIDVIIGNPINNFLIKINAPAWIIGLFSNALIGGVGGLFSFIPQVVLLFLFLSFLEESGYMSRLAFCFEDLFYKFGLSGKSIFTVIMSFGCTTTAILTSRNIEDKNTKIKTALISPYMSCSAKLPVYAVIGGAFFGKGNIFIIISLYIIGVIVGLLLSKALSRKILQSGERSFILEFPPYRFPNLKKIIIVIVQNIKSFIIKITTILLSFSVIVWIFQNFSFKFEYIPTSQSAVSMLEFTCEKLSFIFRPIGLDNWGIVASLFVGIVAKEMIVGTMAIINKLPNTNNFTDRLGESFITSGFVINFSPITAIIMMIFSLLYMPCISTIAVMKKEIGIRWTIISCLLQFIIAYFICFVIYNFYIGNIISKILISLSTLFFIVFIFYLSNKLTKKNNLCNFNCKNCKKCSL